MPNNRIFYASHTVNIGGTPVTGAQSVAVNTNFNLEQVFQLGRLAIYENLQTDPDVEVTVNKALDGYSTIWSLATGGGTLVANANDQADVLLGIGNDTDEFVGQNAGTVVIQMTGMYVSSLNYTFPVDGNFTEEVVFVGSDKTITGSVSAPASLPGPNVLRRQNFKMSTSTFPAQVAGKNLSNVSISADFGREKMYKLGQLTPFHRFVNFPLEITVTFDVISGTHDGVTVDTSALSECDGLGITEQEIIIELCDEDGNTVYTFDLGQKCQLQSVSYSGGDTGGGNVTTTYTYITYNELDITG